MKSLSLLVGTWIVAGAGLVAGVSLAAQAPAPSTTTGLQPGDQIQVMLYDFPDLPPTSSSSIVVRPDGTVHLPYAGDVEVQGLDVEGAEKAIGAQLVALGYVRKPNLAVNVVSAQNYVIHVMGEVKKPEPITTMTPLPLQAVLERDGGLTMLAATHLSIIHPSGSLPTDIDYDPESPTAAAMNTLIAPGDIVHVGRVDHYIMVGEINRQGIFTMGASLADVAGGGILNSANILRNITLLQAIAAAGGITPIAGRSKITILRTVEGKREAIIADYVKIAAGKEADPVLKPNDIVYVPSSYIRSVTNNIIPTVISAIYAAFIVKQL